jgi:hypothetical protein
MGLCVWSLVVRVCRMNNGWHKFRLSLRVTYDQNGGDGSSEETFSFYVISFFYTKTLNQFISHPTKKSHLNMTQYHNSSSDNNSSNLKLKLPAKKVKGWFGCNK